MKKTDYHELKTEIDKYLARDINWSDLKHTTAPLGIYQQRNDLFMIRIRVVGGEITIDKLKIIRNVMNTYGIGYMHLTTRQNIQLHDVKPESIHSIIIELTKRGFPFRGGGGDTFRNIIVSTESGLSKDSVFDVYPYAKALNEFMLNYDKAFDLPRKFKIGFSSSETDTVYADLQDLGFVAREYKGKKGFKVFAGGGMGRNLRYGIKLFNFLPLCKLVQCAKAMTDLFYDHGDRTNRNKARLRFVLNRLGEDEFINLFNNYYLRTSADLPTLEDIDFDIKSQTLKNLEKTKKAIEGFENWKEYAVSDTILGEDIVSVKLFVPWGNLNVENVGKIVYLIEELEIPFLRISQSQDIVLPMVHKESLISIYSSLKNEFENLDLFLESFKGHILSCIGSNVCKIGIVNAPEFADSIALKFDYYFQGKSEDKSDFIRDMLPYIKISGCPNSCSGHFISKLGLYGIKKKIDGELFEGVILKEAWTEEERFIPLNELPGEVLKASGIS